VALAVLPSSTRTSRVDFSASLTAFVSSEGAQTVVTLRGEVDAPTASGVSRLLSSVIAGNAGDVVVDLAELDFMDCATARALASGRQSLESAGRGLTFRSPSRVAIVAMDVYGLTDLIEVRR
jgi:anti-anti-sigma factor